MPLAKIFFDYLRDDPTYYFTIVIVVIVSIVLHELGHGVAAIRQGDDTPIVTGHMTWNPYVHMGGLGLGLLFFVGIAFGLMPVNPRKFRDKYGDAYVAAAGPAVNLVLSILALTVMGLLWRNGIEWKIGSVEPLWIMGLMNMVLFLLNMIPVPPLDGSVVLGNFVPAYREWTRANPGASSIAFILIFVLAGKLFEFGGTVCGRYLAWVVGI